MAPETTVAPMLAKAVPTVPEPDSVTGGLVYEPKWDGFRGIVSYDGEHVEIGSRGAKPLTRYFPELVEAFARLLPGPCMLDGEIVVSTGAPGHERLSWEALTQRIHPAASRVELLARETPAMFVAFDLLSVGGRSIAEQPFSERRTALEELVGELGHPIHITRITTDVELARRWFEEFEGAGLDGVVAKPLLAPYAPGKRVMLKAKHRRTHRAMASDRSSSGSTTTQESSATSGACRRSATPAVSSSSTSWRSMSSATKQARRSPERRIAAGSRRARTCRSYDSAPSS
jgi:ATP-dependent DNA ligase